MEPIIKKIPGVYLDCSKAPIKSKWFISLIDILDKNDMKYLFVKFGEYFPWNEDFKFKLPYVYPEQVLEGFTRKASQTGITIIPVLSLEKEMDFIRKGKHYRYLTEGLHISSGVYSLYEEMIMDVLSLFPNVPYICLDFPEKKDSSIKEILTRLKGLLPGEGKKLIVESDKVTLGNSGNDYDKLAPEGENYNLTLNGTREGLIPRLPSDFDILIPSCFEDFIADFFKVADGSSKSEKCLEIKKNFNTFTKLHKEVWKLCISSFELMTRIDLRPDSSEVLELMSQFNDFRISFGKLKEKSDICTKLVSEDYEDSYIDRIFISKIEPLEMLLQLMSFKVRKIKRRLF